MIEDQRGITVNKIVEGGLAHAEGHISLGDILVAVSGSSVRDLHYKDAIKKIRLVAEKSLDNSVNVLSARCFTGMSTLLHIAAASSSCETVVIEEV